METCLKAAHALTSSCLLLPAVHRVCPLASDLQLIWPGLFARHGGRLSYDFDLSTLAHLSEGYTAGDLDAVVAGLMTPARKEALKQRPVDIPEVLQWLCRVSGWD
jgi:hypothetical protein